jgi:hypothetical protein
MSAERDKSGDGETDHHIIIDAEHERAEALVDLGATGLGYALSPADACVAVEVGHVSL